MQSYRISTSFAVAGALFVMQFQSIVNLARASDYAWSGSIVPIGSDDPWRIGEQGQTFDLDVTVASIAPDLLGLNSEFAAFDVDNARLRLNGQESIYIGSGIIDFSDNSLNGFDTLVFTGVFEHLGHAVEIGSSLTLSSDTFQFLELMATPPIFGSALTLHSTTFGTQGPYAGIVAAGTLVFVAPEPSSVAFLVSVGICYVVTRFLRCPPRPRERPNQVWNDWHFSDAPGVRRDSFYSISSPLKSRMR